MVKSTKRRNGEMAEWLKAHAWKACIPQGIQGSNPCLSATFSEVQRKCLQAMLLYGFDGA